MDLKSSIREIPDFPNPGILFRDITTTLKSPAEFCAAVDAMQEKIKDFGDFDLILGPESRGFIFGTPIAYNLKKAFVPVRKAGKLPCEVYRKSYDLEYGSATIEVHKDALQKGDRVVVVDDLLASGGTSRAIAELVREAGAEVAGMVFFIELADLNGREMLGECKVESVVVY